MRNMFFRRTSLLLGIGFFVLASSVSAEEMPMCSDIDPGLACREARRLEDLPSCEEVDPGLPCATSPQARRLIQSFSSLQSVYQATGSIYESIDGGAGNPSGTVQVNKKTTDSTVKKAFLFASIYRTSFIPRIRIGGVDFGTGANPWDWTASVQLNPSFQLNSYGVDATTALQSTLDALPVGLSNLNFQELINSGTTDGIVLAVIFDDPNEPSSTSVSILFGGQDTSGDSFTLGFASPITQAFKDNANSKLELSLGIGFGFQPSGPAQFSTIDVNGQRLTSAAGGFDDGTRGNGGLITVGGIGDDPANPSNPFANTGDDELYTLIPFVDVGDTVASIATANPSNDDIIFFASLTSSIAATVVVDETCGNGELDIGEQCDDGNTVDGDGCSANCLNEEVVVNGDPHFLRWGQSRRDSFHGECDIVMIRSDDVTDNGGFEVHLRTTMQDDSWSYVEASAVRVGEDVFEFQRHAVHFNGLALHADDFPMRFGDGHVIDKLEKDKDIYQLDLADAMIKVRATSKFMAVAVSGNKKALGNSVGMMGEYGTGELIGRTGQTVDTYENLGFEWQVRPEDPVLFRESREPQLPYERCRMPSWAAMARRRLRASNQNSDLYEEALGLCKQNFGVDYQLCVEDVMLTGDLALADVI